MSSDPQSSGPKDRTGVSSQWNPLRRLKKHEDKRVDIVLFPTCVTLLKSFHVGIVRDSSTSRFVWPRFAFSITICELPYYLPILGVSFELYNGVNCGFTLPVYIGGDFVFIGKDEGLRHREKTQSQPPVSEHFQHQLSSTPPVSEKRRNQLPLGVPHTTRVNGTFGKET